MKNLDEEIARLQKINRTIKKYELAAEIPVEQEVCQELTQEEIEQAMQKGKLEYFGSTMLFEKIKVFEEQVSLPVIKDFFEMEEEDACNISFSKGKELAIILSKNSAKGKDKPLIQLKLELAKTCKQRGIYIEFLESKEDKVGEYSRKINSFKVASAVGYIYNYQVLYNNKKVVWGFNLNCLDEERVLWEKIIKAMAELIEIEGKAE